jgi:hypothetical protein
VHGCRHGTYMLICQCRSIVEVLLFVVYADVQLSVDLICSNCKLVAGSEGCNAQPQGTVLHRVCALYVLRHWRC